MLFQQLRCGGDRNFGYLIADEKTRKCALVDPSPDPDPAIQAAKDKGFKIVYVINTHDHYDHTAGNAEVKQMSGAKVILHSSSPLGEVKVNDGDILQLGTLRLKVIHTPGHTKDSICVLVDDHLITGDFLFVGKVGGTYGRSNALIQFENLKRLLEFNDAVTVWPGHDYGVKPGSTIKEERENNPFCVRLDNFEEFLYLKENWAEYTKEHGIK